MALQKLPALQWCAAKTILYKRADIRLKLVFHYKSLQKHETNFEKFPAHRLYPVDFPWWLANKWKAQFQKAEQINKFSSISYLLCVKNLQKFNPLCVVFFPPEKRIINFYESLSESDTKINKFPMKYVFFLNYLTNYIKFQNNYPQIITILNYEKENVLKWY